MRFKFKGLCFLVLGLLMAAPQFAHADYQQRFSLGAGVLVFNNPSGTYFELGAEYEYRENAFIGLGGFANYIFSSPGIVELGAPELFFHPFATEFLLDVSPIIEFGSGITTEVGARFGTRLPIPFGVFTLVPIFAVDVISGGPLYNIGIGIEF